MSSNIQNYLSDRQLQVNTNLAKLFPYGSEDRQVYVYTNSTYVTQTLPAGTVMGVVNATGQAVAMTSGAADGSQFPVGILAQDYTVLAGAQVNISIMVKGQVRVDMIILQGVDTLSTIVSGRRIFERIGADTVGILIDSVTSCTNFENSLP